MKSLINISNSLNLTKQEFTTVEKHILLITLLHLKNRQGFGVNIEEKLVVSFPATDIKETNLVRIKESLDKITSRKIFFDESTKSKDYFGYIVPFTYANYEGRVGASSTITVELNSRCNKLFLELANGYTTTDLQTILSLKSVHAIRMYELLMMYRKKNEWVIELDRLKGLLGLNLTAYKSFTDFETRILKYTQKELSEHCNLFFNWEIAAKERKKITSLKFKIQDVDGMDRELLAEETSKTIDYVSSLGDIEVAAKVRAACLKYTFTEKQIQWILETKERISELIRIDLIVEDKISKGKPPRNRTKYVAKSMGFDKLKL
ncbi:MULTISPECIES: replication initiation protein [unclassified Siphonobacter]|uniref:replication initiation protein n=1 Tax=unclassified Siphonobacter TaxID=2635712 RepID=UPI002782DB9F|nr:MULTISPECIES: replication initiation protein [unclassified Siphonobacter]MDQ1085521.1 plasmid replication initiation protein [Siphonobacter sp. SORGH_AS_1065]MDR6197395.1 plasmid replication initiation protein [Siphonobacter sp. SORGH_AS_0500]